MSLSRKARSARRRLRTQLSEFGRRDLGVGRLAVTLGLETPFIEALLDPVEKFRGPRLADIEQPYCQPVERLGRRLRGRLIAEVSAVGSRIQWVILTLQ